MIRLLLLLPLVAANFVPEHTKPICTTCVLVNNTCFNVTHVLDLQAPFRNQIVVHKLGVLRSENLLFYAFEPRIEDAEYYKIGFVNLDNQNISGVITSDKMILNFGSFDIDQDNSLVYLGGSDGIFVLDTTSNKLTPYSSRGDTIKTVFYKNNVYFVRNEDDGIVIKRGDTFTILLEVDKIKNFVVNKYDVVVFLTRFGLFVGKGENVLRISTNAFFRGLGVDLDGSIYAWWIDSIYKVIVDNNLLDSKVVKIADIAGIGSMTFDNNNNILFTSDRGLYRLIQTNAICH